MPATFRRSVKVGTEYHVSSLTDDKPAFERVCWTPPEKMIDKQRQTDRAGDVYNYGLIFLEVRLAYGVRHDLKQSDIKHC